MKRIKSVKFLIVSVFLVSMTCGILFAGCNSSGSSHILYEIEATEPTCSQDGYDKHYECSHCNLLFSDAEAKNEISLEDIVRPKLEHVVVWKEAKSASCTEDGYAAHFGCTRCNAAFTDETGTTLLTESPFVKALGHDEPMSYTDEKAPTISESGNIAYYHCNRCGKNFNNKYGDTVLDEVQIPQLAEIKNVTISINGYKNGAECALEGEVSFQGDFGQSISKNITDSAVQLDTVYAMPYIVSCGEYKNTIRFEEGKQQYSLRLEYPYATSIGQSDTGNSIVDLSKMNDVNHTIAMSDTFNTATGTKNYTEVRLNLPDDVKESNATTVSFTLKHIGSFDSTARFGVKMDGTNGIFVSAFGSHELQVCVFWRDKVPNDMFDGYDMANTKNAVKIVTALQSAQGLPIRVVRIGSNIRMFAFLNTGCLELINYQGVATCDTNADTDIKLSILAHQWEFSEIEYGILSHQEEIPVDESHANGQFEHYSYGEGIGKLYFNVDGTIASEAQVKIEKLEAVRLTLTDVNGSPLAKGTAIALTQSALKQTIVTEVGNGGIVTLSGEDSVYKMPYSIQVEDYNGFFEYTFSEEIATYRITAMNTSNSASGESRVDLSKVHDQNSTIVLSDAIVHNNGTVDYTEAKLELPMNVLQAKNAVTTFTLKYLGSGWNPYARVGIKMTETGGMFITVFGDHIEVCVFGRDAQGDMFNGYDRNNYRYTSNVQAALQSTVGLPMMMVRANTQIRLYAMFGGIWTELVSMDRYATCKSYENTDIRFLVLGHEWEFSNIRYDAMELIAEQPATKEQNGRREHLSAGDLEFLPDGSLGTDANLTILYLAETTNVKLTLNGRKDGVLSVLGGDFVLTNPYDASVTVRGSLNESGMATFDRLYALTYRIECGDYYGTVTFAEDEQEYTVTLEYRYATETGKSNSGLSETDFSRMNDESHTIILKDITQLATTNYTEAKLNLPKDIQNAKNATVSFTLKFKGNNFNDYSRFGVKMTENNGIFVSVFGSDRVQVCVLFRDKAGDIFDGYDNANHVFAQAIASALQSNTGLQVRVVRAGSNIRMFAFLEGEWWELVNMNGVATCDENEVTDIRLLILGHEWEFSDIRYAAMQIQPEKPATTEEDGNIAYMQAGDMYFRMDGTLTSDQEVIIPKIVQLDEVALTLKGYKDGTLHLLTGTVELTAKAFDTVQVTATDGEATAEGVYTVEYNVVCGEYFGTIVFAKGVTSYTLVLQYRYATNTSSSDTGNSFIDFSDMNKENHTIRMSDTFNPTTGTKNYTEAKLNLSPALEDNGNVTIEFTLKHTGYPNNLSRFGVKMTENSGVFITVMNNGRIEVCVFYHDDKNDIFSGYDTTAENAQYTQSLCAALISADGLKVRVVRASTEIRMYVYLNETWVELINSRQGVAACGQSDKTDIRLLIMAQEWEFSDIRFFETPQE